MLREVVISNENDAPRKVVIEPYGQLFSVPPQGLMEIAIKATEERVEINLDPEGGITVWLFEAGEISVLDRPTRDARSAAARRRSWGQQKPVEKVVKELRFYARRLAAEDHSPEERELVAARIKWLELTRDILKRGERLPQDLKGDLLAWALSEERLPMREVFIGVLLAAVELGSSTSEAPTP